MYKIFPIHTKVNILNYVITYYLFNFRHSLLAASVIGEINDTFGVKLRVHDLFLNPSVEMMASLLDQNISASNKINLLEELDKIVDYSTM